jgi:hypothetical protein
MRAMRASADAASDAEARMSNAGVIIAAITETAVPLLTVRFCEHHLFVTIHTTRPSRGPSWS